MYVMRFSIHGTISPVKTYRRCALDSWSTWRRPYCRIGTWPWYMAEREVRSMCLAQLHPSVCCGVYGAWIVGATCLRTRGLIVSPYHCRKCSCRCDMVLGTVSPSPS